MISTFAFPTQIVSGEGALAELPDRLRALGVHRPLVITDPGLLPTPAYALLREVLGDVATFSGVHPNPVEEDVTAAIAALREGGHDGVIAFGGGSALDVGKIARVTDRPWADVTWRDELRQLPPLIAIPTTAGTGSEVGRSSVITLGHTKRVVFHPALLASLVILEPRVTSGLPKRLTAATGADALTHCIEAFTSPVNHPLCEAIAIEGVRIVFEALPEAVEQGSDLHARSRMQIAAMMGGIAFQKDLGAVHSLAHPLSGHLGMHHGLANALCLCAVMRWNAERKAGLYGRLAVAIGLTEHTDAAFIAAVEELLQKAGLTGGLRAQGVTEANLDLLADAAFADGCHATNPVPVTRADLLALYRAAL